jgi:CNT family concentrative nucleoside transporter
VEGLAAATRAGTRFVFGYLGGGPQPYAVSDQGRLFVFAFEVLPLILVISALSALLWHWRVLKWIIRGLGSCSSARWAGRCERVGDATNIFLGRWRARS